MTSYESDFDAALNRGRVYDSAEQLRYFRGNADRRC